ncbi:hypothetical protein GQR58_030628 [Nymphon striatum]|nr:hypothetical protein GQR58_030628 [Nymphon striatum]
MDCGRGLPVRVKKLIILPLCWCGPFEMPLVAGTGPFRAVLRTGRYGLVYMAGVGASGVLFVVAVSMTSVANVVVIIASLPVFASLFSRVFLAEPFGIRTWLTIAAVVPGLAIVAYGSGETQGASLAGDLLALGVSALFAAALTAARHARAVSMVPGVAMGYTLAALMIMPFADPLSMSLDQAPSGMARSFWSVRFFWRLVQQRQAPRKQFAENHPLVKAGGNAKADPLGQVLDRLFHLVLVDHPIRLRTTTQSIGVSPAWARSLPRGPDHFRIDRRASNFVAHCIGMSQQIKVDKTVIERCHQRISQRMRDL